MPRYKVTVYDNFNYMRPEGQWDLDNTFETLDDALAECKRVVETSLQEFNRPDVNADDMFQLFRMYGEAPSIVALEAAGGDAVRFDPLEYAKGRSAVICAER